jgi:hypothetical protein
LLFDVLSLEVGIELDDGIWNGENME